MRHWMPRSRTALLALPALLACAGPAFAAGGGEHGSPSVFAAIPFIIILLCIALLPLIRKTEHWWHHNSSKLLVSGTLGAVTLGYYFLVRGYHTDAGPGLESIGNVLSHAVVLEYIPFMALLFSLYTIAGGIELSGDLKGQPRTNTAILGVGAAIASFVGTTGAAMLLIRPLLRANQNRKSVVHTVVFFIFAVCNCGGLLLPIGDPPLFLGYLRGVPFEWTLQLWPEFLIANGVLLATYFVWDTLAYKKEQPEPDDPNMQRAPLALTGKPNLLLLAGVIFCVATLDPAKAFPGTEWHPPRFMREGLMMALAGASYFLPLFTPKGLRERNNFDFFAINEVGALFIGIFITMQVPLEILNDPTTVEALGVDTPMKFFWATGGLSAFLDNAPTYVVFFQTALGLDAFVIASLADPSMLAVNDGMINELLLKAISCGAVFLGAMTYIGNGPNFLVKAIAEQAGVKMPSFFGYMRYSVLILGPIFVVVAFVFFT